MWLGRQQLCRIVSVLSHHVCTQSSPIHMSDKNIIVVTVDSDGYERGTCEKLTAHRTGVLHRAFSVFVFDSNGNWLLQKRAKAKYHSGGLWSNACCGHPAPGENIAEAAKSRLSHEMGITCEIHRAFSFMYRAELGDELIENEFDHVFLAEFDGTPSPNSTEVEDWRWVRASELAEHVESEPQVYTHWFRLLHDKVVSCTLDFLES